MFQVYSKSAIVVHSLSERHNFKISLDYHDNLWGQFTVKHDFYINGTNFLYCMEIVHMLCDLHLKNRHGPMCIKAGRWLGQVSNKKQDVWLQFIQKTYTKHIRYNGKKM